MSTHPARGFLADLVRVHPAPGAGRVAVRAGTGMLLVLLALWAAGHLTWALYATFGAFAAVYGGRAPRPGRWRTQALVGSVLTAAVASGALVSTGAHRSLVVVPVAAAWAALAAVLAEHRGWRPPGPMFFVFAVAACGSVPLAGGGAGLHTAVVVTLVTAATVVLAVLLGVLETRVAVRRTVSGPVTSSPPPVPPVPPRSVGPVVTAERGAHAVRCAVVVVVAGALALVAGIGHPYWAMVAAVTPLSAPTFSARVVRGVQRTVGTLVGVLVAALLLTLPLPVPVVIAVVAALQAVAELLVTRNYGLAMLFITPLALLSVQLAVPQPVGVLVGDRVLETLIGVAVGLAGALTARRAAPVVP